jgi:dipeptidyl aminopeptidase/acylaminoacyl peptidase
MLRKSSPQLLFVFLLLASCGPGKLFGPTITPTYTFTPKPTNTPTFTSTFTFTFTPSSTDTPTETFTPSPTPISGANALVVSCQTQKYESNYFNYNLSTNTYSVLVVGSYPLNYYLSTLGVRANVSEILPNELLNDCCLRFLAASNDRQHLLFQKSGPLITDITKLYWVDVSSRLAKVIRQFTSGHIVQETKIDPSGNYVVIRMPEADKQNLYLINLQTGEPVKIPTDANTLPYRISWKPDGRGFTYTLLNYDTYGSDTWLFDINTQSQTLIIKNGAAADWSPDGKQLVFQGIGGLFRANLGQDPIPVNSVDGKPVSAEFPEWVPVNGYNKIIYWDNMRWVLQDLTSQKQTTLITLTGSIEKQLGYSVQWSPDGHWFLGTNFSKGISYIYLCNIDKGKCVPLDANGPDASNYVCGGGWWSMNTALSPLPTP